MKKILYSMTALLILMTATACSGNKTERTERDIVVKVDTVRAEGQSKALQLPGRIIPASEVNASFKVAGTLRKVYVNEGSRVAAGQLLAEIDPVDYQVQLSATEAEYAQIKADAERVMGLYADGATTASNNDKARYGLQQIEAKLQHHRNQVAYTKIYAPFSGVVQKRYFDGGETVAAGMPVVSVLSDGDMEVEVNLPAASYMHREKFASYTCTLDILPDETFGLKLISILPKANANQLYTMRLRFDKKNAQIAAGMNAWVTVKTSGEGSDMVRIPTTALLEDGGKCYAYKYNASSGKVSRTEVKVSSLRSDGTAVVEGQLMEDELVVSTGVHHLKDGDKVRLLAPVSKTNVGGML